MLYHLLPCHEYILGIKFFKGGILGKERLYLSLKISSLKLPFAKFHPRKMLFLENSTPSKFHLSIKNMKYIKYKM